MFFLGGLNNILPHLIYLSVIWAFLLIGFSGRFRFHVSEESPETKAYCNVQSSHEFDHSTDFDAEAAENEHTTKTNLNGPSYFLVFYESAASIQASVVPPDYRGPPYC